MGEGRASVASGGKGVPNEGGGASFSIRQAHESRSIANDARGTLEGAAGPCEHKGPEQVGGCWEVADCASLGDSAIAPE